MNMNTNLPGRLRNTSLPYSHAMHPLFEAVVNSIHSIEDAGLAGNGSIKIEIQRDEQKKLEFDGKQKKRGPDTLEEVVGFKITDNGIGFDDKNMESFNTLDSDYKADRGCRGVGRLMWLKAFKRVNVSSVYKDGDSLKSRSFVFTTQSGVSREEISVAPRGVKRSTSVHLDGFEKRYRESSRKTARAIANSLFEHCLWYFVREGGAPNIIIKDSDESINLDDIYEEHMVSSAITDAVTIKKEQFDLTHVKLRVNSSQSHIIAFCASNRLVKEESITGKLPGLYGKIKDENGEFVYACYVSSSFLDRSSRPERTGFDIMENGNGLFSQTEISLSEIRDTVMNKVSKHLSGYLEENEKKGRKRIEDFVSKRAPRYRPILKRIPKERLGIDPEMSDKELDVYLHRHLSEIESKLLADGHDVMCPKETENAAEYRERLNEYLQTAEDIKKSDLANYVSHRKVILDLLETAIQRKEDGSYCREDMIHNLIMPMGTDSNMNMFDRCNLWLVDESLAFHDYLASDKTLDSMPITGSSDTKEPDLCALNVYDTPVLVSEGSKLPLASIVIIELKRPMRNDAKTGEEKDPVEQALGYLSRIREGKVTTAVGRPIPSSNDIPGFCYAVCDITPTIKQRCLIHGLKATSDHMGYFGYNPNYNAYIEVLSFDRLVNSAKARNRAFFDKLGLPTT